MAAIDEKIPTKLTTENTKNRLGLWDNLITEELKMLHKKFSLPQLIRLVVVLPLSPKRTMIKF